MTQQDLATALGVSRSAVAMWEAGMNRPNSGLLIPLSKILDCRIEDILADLPAGEQT